MSNFFGAVIIYIIALFLLMGVSVFWIVLEYSNVDVWRYFFSFLTLSVALYLFEFIMHLRKNKEEVEK